MNSILDRLGPGLSVVLFALIAIVVILSVLVAVMYRKMSEFDVAYKRHSERPFQTFGRYDHENMDIVEKASEVSQK